MNDIFYAHKLKCNDGKIRFIDFYLHPKLVKMCTDGPVFKVCVREVKEGEKSDYWGWFSNEKKEYSMIWPSKVQNTMCFPDGPEAEEKLGRGRQVNLIVEEIEEV